MQYRGHSQHKTPQTPSSNTHDRENMLPKSQRVNFEYMMQYERWDELRQKMKSMQIGKIGVTSYMEQGRRKERESGMGQPVVRSEVRLEVFQSDSKKINEKLKQKWQQDFDMSKLNALNNKIYSSRNKQKTTKPKAFQPYTPYFSYAYQLQKSIPTTKKNKTKQAQVQNPQYSCNLQPQNEEKSKQLIHRSQERKKIKTSASYYKKNRHQNATKINFNKGKTSRLGKAYTNDLIQFSKITPQDYTLRTIIRRKSNILPNCIESIQASILANRILLFTLDITSGNANYFAEIKAKPPTEIFNDNCESVRPVSEIPSKNIAHTTTGSHQMRLMMGSGEIADYCEIFGLSRHSLEIGASIAKLGVVLVDFLTITEKGLKIDRNQLMNNLGSLSLETKNLAMEQISKQLRNNQLIRWKNTKKSLNRIHSHNHNNHNNKSQNLAHDKNVINHYHQPQKQKHLQGESECYMVYGHPHPVVNSKQYQMIKSYENKVTNLEHSGQIVLDLPPSLTPSQKKPLKNDSKAISQQIEQQPNKNAATISVAEEVIPNDSCVMSRNDNIVDQC